MVESPKRMDETRPAPRCTRRPVLPPPTAQGYQKGIPGNSRSSEYPGQPKACLCVRSHILSEQRDPLLGYRLHWSCLWRLEMADVFGRAHVRRLGWRQRYGRSLLDAQIAIHGAKHDLWPPGADLAGHVLVFISADHQRIVAHNVAVLRSTIDSDCGVGRQDQIHSALTIACLHAEGASGRH